MFYWGYLAGVLTMVLILALMNYFTYWQEKKYKKEQKRLFEVADGEIRELIKEKKEKLYEVSFLGVEENAKRIRDDVIDLTKQIGKKYYPDSKEPIYELSIEEILELNIHISERLLKSLNLKRFELLKKLKISDIIYLNNLKNKVMNYKVVKKANELKILDKIWKSWMLLNIANPSYWVRKVLYNGALEVSMRSLGILSLNIVGDEINSVYTKKYKKKSQKLLQ